MQTARRLYLYLLSGVSLGVLVTGLSLLLTVLFDAVGFRSDSPFGDGDIAVRERLTLAAALTSVSLPVWLIHWAAAERSVRPQRPNADEERTSAIRGLYFALAMGLLLLFAVTSAVSSLQTAFLALMGQSLEFHDAAGPLGPLLAAGAAWAYHVWIRARDWSRGPLQGAGAWLPRTYLYVAAYAGLLMLLFGATQLIDLAGRLNVPPQEVEPGASWWAFPLAAGATQMLVGGVLWLSHWWYANRLLADIGWHGASMRTAKLRLAFFVAVILTSATSTLVFLAGAGRLTIEAALGVSSLRSGTSLLSAVAAELLSAAVFGLAWWLHARLFRREARLSEVAYRGATVRRLSEYALSLVGLAAGAVGVGWLLGMLIDVVFGGNRSVVQSGEPMQRDLALYLPFAVLGAALWIWQWLGVSNDYRADPAAEAASTTRRTALLLILAASVLSGVASSGIILYRVFASLLGVVLRGNTVSELSTPIGFLLIALAVAAYHAAALRRDQALRAAMDSEEPVVPEGTRVIAALRLAGPPEGDLREALATLRSHLPVGFTLDPIGIDGLGTDGLGTDGPD